MSALRRYEILLPSQFNDGRPIPQEYTDIWLTTYPVEVI
jgi:hypothetical protein